MTWLHRADGTEVERVEYDPYGERLVEVNQGGTYTAQAVSSVGLDVSYTGHRHDVETGLLYARNRYLRTDWGRFMTLDPLGEWADGGNLGNGYAYATNSPAVATDPLGLLSVFAEMPGSGFGGGAADSMIGNGLPDDLVYSSDGGSSSTPGVASASGCSGAMGSPCLPDPLAFAIMVTSYGPFGSVTHNPSRDYAAATTKALTDAGQNAEHVELTTNWDAFETALTEFQKKNPNKRVIVVAFGVDPQGTSEKVEATGQNRMGPYQDVNGNAPKSAGQPIDPNVHGPLRNPGADAIVRGLKSRGIQASRSDNAGDFICNRAVFAINRGIANGELADGIFTHVPGSPGPGAPGTDRIGEFGKAMADVFGSRIDWIRAIERIPIEGRLH